MKVLGISTSPRARSNSDILLRKAIEGAQSAGAKTEYVRLADLNLSPCTECNECYQMGVCPIEDDYPLIRARMLEADRLIFATPVFFMTVCAQAKTLIDRCQDLWSQKYVLKKPLARTAGRDRRAMVIAVGGTKGKKMFDCVRQTIKYFLDAIDMRYAANLFVNNIDAAGAIEKHDEAIAEAYRLGAKLAKPGTKPPETRVEVELFT